MRDDGLQLGARDKVVTKMTREGAVEENKSQNSERRVSARASDADFSHLYERGEQAQSRELEERSRTKAQQRRYYRGQDDAGQGSDGYDASDGASAGDANDVNADFGSEAAASNNSANFDSNISTNGKSGSGAGSGSRSSGSCSGEGSSGSSGPSGGESGDHSSTGSSLSEKSVRSENVKSDRSSSDSSDSDDRKHAQKKKQTQDAQKQKTKESKLKHEEEASKGTNLGGRFSSLAGKATMGATDLVDQSLEGMGTDDENASGDVVHRSESIAVSVSRRVQNRSSRKSSRASAQSKRAEAVEYGTEARAAKLQFEVETEGAKAASEIAKAAAKSGKTATDAASGSAGSAAKKEFQRRNRNKRYAASFRSAEKSAAAGASGAGSAAKTAGTSGSFFDKLKNKTVGAVKNHKGTIVAVIAAGMALVMMIGNIGTVGSVIAGMGNTVMQSSYLASDDEIYAAEDYYSSLEAALQEQINNIESQYPGYDEYNYQVDEISHNPYSLTSYLTVLYGNYKASDVKAELDSLFQAQYGITVEGKTETITETRTVRVGESLGQVVTSGYCNCVICCGQWSGGPTASGAYPTANHTIAVDASNPTVPIGTKVVMNGVEYTVEDTGNFARYGVDFDVYYDSHSAASAHGHQTWEAYLADDNGTQSVEVTDTRTVKVLNVTLTNNSFDTAVRSRLTDSKALNWYNILNASYGNRDYLWDTTAYSGYTAGGMSYEIPPEALNDQKFRNMITEAEKYLGYPYVWGGASPSTSFDCSGFVSWVINNCGNGWNVGRLTAEGLRGVCTYVSPAQAKPGDLIFFQGTYDTPGASHVGIYVGNGMMIHCGNPIQYTSIETNYWQQHFFCFGRIN